MIAFVRGTCADLQENSVVVETGGIGFEIFMTGKALSRIKIGDEVKIHTCFSVKEDGMQLYGFFSKDDLKIFRLLLGVNGIGPKGAMGILSVLTADELRFAILSDDSKTIAKAPGIGRKTAQKLILELRDKLDLGENSRSEPIFITDTETVEGDGGLQDAVLRDAVEALTALGYNQTEAYRVVRKVSDPSLTDVEAILKAALKNM